MAEDFWQEDTKGLKLPVNTIYQECDKINKLFHYFNKLKKACKKLKNIWTNNDDGGGYEDNNNDDDDDDGGGGDNWTL